MDDVLVDIEHARHVCKIGQIYKTCRYLVCGSKGMECAKHTSLATELDKRTSEKTMTARGDNCEGKGKTL